MGKYLETNTSGGLIVSNHSTANPFPAIPIPEDGGREETSTCEGIPM